MPYVQRSTSMAEIHAIYGDGKSPGRHGETAPAYAKASFSTRDAHHPGFPPPPQPRRSKPRVR